MWNNLHFVAFEQNIQKASLLDPSLVQFLADRIDQMQKSY